MKKKFNWFAVVTFLLGALVGSGAIWQWMNVHIQQDKLLLEKMSQTIELREKISDKLVGVLRLIKEEDLRKNEVRQKYKVMEDDLLEYERKLAHLEGREPRIFRYRDLIRPMPATDLKAVNP